MDEIAAATKDLDIQLVFNNAGFIVVGKHHDVPTGRSFANFECNATAPMKITRHFTKEMVDKKLRGLIAFTSSSAGAFWHATQALITRFSACLRV
jgi:short-subunit dehydrogenase